MNEKQEVYKELAMLKKQYRQIIKKYRTTTWLLIILGIIFFLIACGGIYLFFLFSFLSFLIALIIINISLKIKPKIVCPLCGYRGEAKYNRSAAVEFILFIAFLLPYILYVIFTPKWRCPNCEEYKFNF